jgi:Neuraminidase (sialidase)
MEGTKMKILKQKTIFQGKPNTNYAKTCFPWLTQLSNGELLSSFQAASIKHGIDSKAVLCRSVDGGGTWCEPISPYDANDNGKDGVIHVAYLTELSPDKLAASILWCDHLGNPEMDFFNPKTGGLLPTDMCISFSDDFGKTWSKLQRVEKGDLEGIPTPGMGPIHDLGNGNLICPFETSKIYDDPGTWLHKAAYFISHDNGQTWPEYKVVASDPQSKIFYFDHRIANFGNGKLLDFFWGYDNVNHKELNTYMSITYDNGENWSQPSVTSIVGQPWPIAIDENSFALVSVDRNYSQTIKLYLSDNFGKSFDAAEPLTIYSRDKDYVAPEQLNDQLVEQMQWAYGLPSGIKLNNGNLMITWYAGDETATNIYCCEISL